MKSRIPLISLCSGLVGSRSTRRSVALRYVLLLGLVTTVSLACTKSADSIDPDKQSPPPSGVGGKWSYGTFSPSSFWGTGGTYNGSAYEQSIAFNFGPNGAYEMYVMNFTTYYSCRTGAYSYFKGKAKFNEADQSISLTPTEGTQRGEYSCTPDKDFKRAAKESELQRSTFSVRYEKTTNSKGKPALRVYFGNDDQQGVIMEAGNW
ncbi:hypothetical protein [Fibrella aquatilis]|uniref:Uncharacterized protein n=1 Tax=Fibrella aquatilis TaxID=2817059 RepID=A0A939G8D7_9BACT|nr:hypothetical protein [Fibrella aquatilis]MBO0932519.1 hypothetical protein [Fibrella aquatilis]